ncbi:cytochrome c biogenesis protein ResB [Thiohalomonas denitrificans]|uniref:cytochrome c biogenesis protein ResB n=1 Tax=Thiohalomonas denitrificans TaxID=415747 RepID=UPI0026E9ABC2|nr:cytochrome c biogenesis protein ResB [Thiohalomonas denitrificans]
MNGTSRPSPSSVLFRFLGSMNLAITLLVAVSIASIIGTVLQQNLPYNDYVIKFGPFWFEVFNALGLYDVYGTPWFLVLLGLLLVSTTVCVFRNTPAIIRDMRHFRLDVQTKSLRSFRHHAEWSVKGAPSELADRLGKQLKRDGYRTRQGDYGGNARIVGAMRGSMGRLGYLLSHSAIVIICIGGLMDGNLPLKFADSTGKIRAETRDLPIANVPAKSVIASDSGSFRGTVNIPEGSSADFVYLGLRDGYLVQKLPFEIALDEFRIEHYPTGQPKSYESDLIIFDEELEEPLRKTIAVNHPLVYKGYAIYQSSFSDGGSRMVLQAHSLDNPDTEALRLEGRIGQRLPVETPRGKRTVELIDFKPFNIFPIEEEDGSEGQKNFGPSVIFRLRDASGEALEYVNYMQPVPRGESLFFLSGVRSTPSEPYQYLHLPLDENDSLKRFLRLRAKAMEMNHLQTEVAAQLASMAGSADAELPQKVANSIVELVQTFVAEGIGAVVARVESSAPEAEQDAALKSFVNVIQNTLGAIYVDLLAEEEGKDLGEGVSAADQRFFEDAMNALSLMGSYGSPFVAQLTDFEQVQASGLQITKSPGKDIVYLGCVMLMAGVFFMFYMHHRRLWVRIEEDGENSRILFAGTGHRNRGDFGKEFQRLQRRLKAVSDA